VAWLIFILYLVFFSWLITRIGFIKRSGLSNKLLIGLFSIKILAGIIYFQFHSLPEYRYRSDTWKFYDSSLQETKKFKQAPGNFVAEIFTSNYSSRGGLFSDQNSYWNDVKDTVMIKLVAVTNLFTFNNYYANIIFFNFIFFLGLVAFYRLMKTVYPDKKYGLIAAIFLIPTFLFWCSGIHKDGLIFSCIGMTMCFFHSLLYLKRKIVSITIIIISLVLIFFLRNYLALVLLLSLFAGWLLYVWPKRKLLLTCVLFISGIVFFFYTRHIHPSLNFPSYVVDKQQQFKKLEGTSVIQTADLQPNPASFMSNLPKAIDMGFFRPHPGEKGLMSLAASVEIILFWLLILLCLTHRQKKISFSPVVWSCVIFAVLTLLIIGYTVPFSGAIVRYRSLILPLLLAPAVGSLVSISYINKRYI
jgi:hypothetical protein